LLGHALEVLYQTDSRHVGETFVNILTDGNISLCLRDSSGRSRVRLRTSAMFDQLLQLD
jgi:hypothetical protein